MRVHAQAFPHKTALNFYGLAISYRELDILSDRLAWFLARRGLVKGDRVALYMQNCPQYVICQIGAHKAGAIVVPCGPMFKAWELEAELKQTGTRAIICQDELYANVQEAGAQCPLDTVIVTGFADYLPQEPAFPLHESILAPRSHHPGTLELREILEGEAAPVELPEVTAQDVCLLQFTSGTTGLPKGAMLTHANQLYKSAAQAQVYKYTPDDVMLTAMPIYHIAGMLWGLTAPLYVGCTMVIMARFEAAAMALAIERLKCSKMYGTVSMNVEMLKLPDLASRDISSLRINPATSFGIFLNEEIARAWGAATRGGLIVEAAYGLSETHTGDTFSPLDKPRMGSVGIPHTGTDLRIVDFDDPERELPPGQVGEITIQSPAVFKGYWERPEATAEALRGGRLYTGDMGRYDEDGYVYFLGRRKEMIKCSGYAVAPEEVEGFLMRHPAVEQAVCIPVPDPQRGEAVKAFIVLKPGQEGQVSEQALLAWAKDKMAAYKCPRFIEFRDEVPKSGTGKLMRRILREEEEARRG
ncbi:MAG: AMP-binding protein [Desulfarculus sp.]|nr:AMP-binding protein [Desulfarculus sp.]